MPCSSVPPVIFPYRDSTLTNCCVNKLLAVPRLTLESWLVAEYVLWLPCSSVPPVIPYRDSTLTKLLYEGLKGNGRVLMMACCSPSKVHLLQFLFPTADYAVQEVLFFTSVRQGLARLGGLVYEVLGYTLQSTVLEGQWPGFHAGRLLTLQVTPSSASTANQSCKDSSP